DPFKPLNAAERVWFTRALMSRVPEDGSSISNRALLEVLGWDEDAYAAIRDRLVEEMILLKGGGPGGSLRRAEAAPAPEVRRIEVIPEPEAPKPLRMGEWQGFVNDVKIPEPTVGKPKVFIGSSREGLEIGEAIQLGLDHVAECTIWTQGV